MHWSEIPWRPGPRVLRQFAAVALALGLGGLAWRGPGPIAVGLAGVGVVGLVRPAAVRPVYVGGVLLGLPVGWLVSRGLLAALFFGLITPLGLARRLAGRDPLGLGRDVAHDPCWAARPAAAEPARYLRPY